MTVPQQIDRREWLSLAAAAGLAWTPLNRSLAGEPQPAESRTAESKAAKRPRVAVLVTEFTYRSHAHVILENFLEPYYFNGKLTDPGVDVVSLYVDQFPAGDMARDTAQHYGFPIFPTIAEALKVGTDQLAVDGVLSIAEHGNYPVNERGQRMYPRKRFFDEIVKVFRGSGRVVPVFNDKHLSYREDWAIEMMQVARELKIPLMAGSSVPLAQRRPPLELPPKAIIDEAVSIHSGGLESYDFHALEVLQSIVEARSGGEAGISEVQLLEGADVWKAAEAGRWNEGLASAAMRAETGRDVGSLRDFVEPADGKRYPVHAILIKHRDGLKSTVLRIGHSSTRWNFACQLAAQNKPIATSFYVGPWENRNLFKALSHAIQTHIRNRRAPYPIERTYLVTRILAAAMKSRFEGHRRLTTPELDVAYAAQNFDALREMGASWKLITEDQPEPAGINPGGPRPSSR